MLMPTPELKTGSGIDWSDEALTQQIKDVIYRKLATIEAFEDIKSHIISETIFTPNDFEQTYHAKFGSAFGLMPTLSQSNYYRPQMYREIIKIYILQVQVRIQVQAFLLS